MNRGGAADEYAVYWRRWTGLASALCALLFAAMLVGLTLDPAFWAGGGADLRLILLLMVFALIANLTLRRAWGTLVHRPAIRVQAKGLLLSDGLAERFVAWRDIERLRLTRSRLAVDLRQGTEGRAAWQFMAQLGVAPPLRFLYAAIDLDKRALYEAVRARTPESFRFDLTQ